MKIDHHPKLLATLLCLSLVALSIDSAMAQSADDCALDDANGDNLVLSTGRARVSSQTSIILDDITYDNSTYSNVEINLDVNTLTWSVERPFPPAGGLDFSNAEVTLIGDNDIRFRGIDYLGVLYDVTLVLHLDGTFSAKDVGLFTGGVSETNSSGFGSWNNSGGEDATSDDNPRYTLTLCNTQSIVIDLTSGADTYLYLLDSNGNIIAENDDRDFDAGDYNSRIEITLAAGDYTVVVATFFTGESDTFDIEVDTNSGDGALNLRAIPGTSFVDYASVGGRVTDSQSGEPISGAEILVFDFLAGNPDVTVFSNSTGDYFLRIFADRLRANTFNAVAAAEGCDDSAAVFGIVNADNHATINFSLDCGEQDNPDDGSNGGNGDDDSETGSISIEAASCTAVRFSFGTIQYNEINLSGTASGPVGASVSGTVDLECSAWTNCERQSGEPASTSWTDYSTTTTASPQGWTANLQSTINSYSASTSFDCPTM